MVDDPPFNLGNSRFVRFIPHDEGIYYRATHGFRCGWIMILSILLDCRRTEYISNAINTIDVSMAATRMILGLYTLWHMFLSLLLHLFLEIWNIESMSL